MNLITAVKNTLSPSKKIQTKRLGFPVDQWSYIGGVFVPYGDTPEKYIEAYHKFAFVYTVVSWIVEKASSVPIELYRVTNESKYRKYKSQLSNISGFKGLAQAEITKALSLEQIDNHRALDLIHNPNPAMSEKELFEQIYGYLLLTGNSFIYEATVGAGRNRGVPAELWVVPSPSVEILAGDRLNLVRGYRVSYDTREISPEEMAHIKLFRPVADAKDTASMLYGLSPMRSLRNSLGVYENAEIAQGTLFKNMSPSGIISGKYQAGQEPDQEQIDDISDQFVSKHTGVYNGKGIVITPADVTWQQIGLSPVDLNVLEGRRDIKQDIASAFHVPIELFQDRQSGLSNGGSMKSEVAKQALTDAVIPLVNRIVDTLNRQVLSKFGEGLAFQADFTVFDALQEEMQEVSAWLAQSPEVTPNEKRKFKGFETLPNPLMDEPLFPTGVTTLEQIHGEVQDIDIDLLDETQNTTEND